MPPKRILLVLHNPPLPFGKAMGRWYYVLLRELVARGHRVVAYVPCSTESEISQTLDLFPRPDYDVRCFLHQKSRGLFGKFRSMTRPFSYILSPELFQDFNAEAARGFDLLHLDGTWCGWLGLSHRPRAVLSVPFLMQIDFADQPVTSAHDAILRRVAAPRKAGCYAVTGT